MYSKVKYDRCKVHKIETKPTKSQYRKTVIDALNENLFKEGLKELNSAKRSRPKSNKNKKTEKYMRKVGYCLLSVPRCRFIVRYVDMG